MRFFHVNFAGILSAISFSLFSCGGGAGAFSVDTDASVADTNPTDSRMTPCNGEQPVAGLAERCCPTFGIDACGPGLFCAAFDGRNFAACYAEHARLDDETCTANVQCLSYRCNLPTGRCSASPNSSCSSQSGCGPGPSAGMFVCAGSHCVASNGEDGRACGLDSDCQSRFCVDERCRSGAVGAQCREPADCSSGLCFANACVSGREGSPCRSDTECIDGYCANDRCSSGERSSACLQDSQCRSRHCAEQMCVDGSRWSACVDIGDCEVGLHCVRECSTPQCSTGACGEGIVGAPCHSREDCATGLFCGAGNLFTRPGFGLCTDHEPTCWLDSDCASGTRCSDVPTGASYCRALGALADGAQCAVDTDCMSLVCASHGPAGMKCSAVGAVGAHCVWYNPSPTIGDEYTVGCSAGFRCNTSTSGAQGTCVPESGALCGARHEGEWRTVVPCFGGVAGCNRRSLRTSCEDSPTTTCTTDAECPGSVCVYFYFC